MPALSAVAVAAAVAAAVMEVGATQRSQVERILLRITSSLDVLSSLLAADSATISRTTRQPTQDSHHTTSMHATPGYLPTLTTTLAEGQCFQKYAT